MQNKFQNKYCIPSARLQTWDYSNNATYFITICTQNREHFFGNIQNGMMQLSEIGKLAEKYWIETPNHFPFVELGNFVVMPNHFHGILILNHTPNPNVETRFIASNNNNKTDETRFIASNNNNKTDETRFIASNNNNKTDETRFIASNNNNETDETRFIASNNNNETDETRFIASNDNDEIKETRLIASLPENVGGFSGDKNPMLNNNVSKIIRWYKGRCSFECRQINPNFGWQSRFHDHIIRNSKSYETIQNYILENPLKWENDKFY
jgi:putative transposase